MYFLVLAQKSRDEFAQLFVTCARLYFAPVEHVFVDEKAGSDTDMAIPFFRRW
jgi:hypothetical protein